MSKNANFQPLKMSKYANFQLSKMSKNANFQPSQKKFPYKHHRLYGDFSYSIKSKKKYRLLLLVVLTDLYSADLAGDGLRKLLHELDDTWVLVRSGGLLYVVLKLLDEIL